MAGLVSGHDCVCVSLRLCLAAFEEVVAVIDVGEVVLVMVILERLARHVGGERIVGIGQLGQRE